MGRLFTYLPYLLLLICSSVALVLGATVLVIEAAETKQLGCGVVGEEIFYRNDYAARQAGVQQNKTGRLLFEENCTVCHSPTYEVVVGPGLAGVGERREREWLHRFITDSEKLIESGDTTAVALYLKYNQIQMPRYVFTTAQLDSILAYLHYESLVTQ